MDRYKIGSGTLNLIMSRYNVGGIPIEELRMMSPKEVERSDPCPESKMNISFCWLDYKEKNLDGYEKSQFYEYFSRFVLS
ncbi:MAG: hypothetical protein ACI4D9_02995 [Lachnospiraceae bacterium]